MGYSSRRSPGGTFHPHPPPSVNLRIHPLCRLVARRFVSSQHGWRVYSHGGRSKSITNQCSCLGRYDNAMDGMTRILLKKSDPSGLTYVSDWNGQSNNHKVDMCTCAVRPDRYPVVRFSGKFWWSVLFRRYRSCRTFEGRRVAMSSC